jgi:hypothetical protein
MGRSGGFVASTKRAITSCPRRIRVASHLRLDVTKPEPRKQNITKPERVWTDPIVYRLRNSSVLVRVYMWISGRFVPMLFALFVAAPVGVLILPFFIPRFIRNANRRRKYEVRLSDDSLSRIPGQK